VTTLGIDIGASKVRYVLLQNDRRARENEFKILPRTRGTLQKIIQEIANEIKKLPPAQKVGVGVPGTIHQGILEYVPNFPALKDWKLQPEIERIFGVPAVLINDAKAFTYAEAQLGAAQGLQNFIGLTLGSGLGGGLYLNRTLYAGKGAAGEVGHEIIDLPNKKEAEEFASAKFFQRIGENPQILRERAAAGDRKANQIFRDFGKNLGIVVANLVNLLDPEAVVLGGGIAEASNFFIRETQETAARFIRNPSSKSTPILRSALGPPAGAIGAALLARL